MEYTKDDVKLKVESTFVETIKGFPHSEHDDMYHNHFMITVSNDSGKTESFDYYGSYNDYCKNKTTIPDNDLRFALGCIIGDALSGLMSFDEFCDEFGYDEDSRRAERIHKAAIITTEKIQSLGINEDEMYVIVNDLDESD